MRGKCRYFDFVPQHIAHFHFSLSEFILSLSYVVIWANPVHWTDTPFSRELLQLSHDQKQIINFVSPKLLRIYGGIIILHIVCSIRHVSLDF
jgi:hypothetical protein